MVIWWNFDVETVESCCSHALLSYKIFSGGMGGASKGMGGGMGGGMSAGMSGGMKQGPMGG